jgi:hypothetical protein
MAGSRTAYHPGLAAQVRTRCPARMTFGPT